MLGAAITPERGVMRHLEDDTTKDFRNTPPHMFTHGTSVHTHTHISSIYRKAIRR